MEELGVLLMDVFFGCFFWKKICKLILIEGDFVFRFVFGVLLSLGFYVGVYVIVLGNSVKRMLDG